MGKGCGNYGEDNYKTADFKYSGHGTVNGATKGQQGFLGGGGYALGKKSLSLSGLGENFEQHTGEHRGKGVGDVDDITQGGVFKIGTAYYRNNEKGP